MRAFAGKLAALRSFGCSVEPDASARRAELDRLRHQIERMIGAQPLKRREPRRLPFEPEETGHGPCHLRRVELGLVERLGGIALERALMIDLAMMALLSLTPALAGCDVERALFLDLETSGLGGGTGNVAFLAGVCFYDRGRQRHVLEQLLLRDPEHEPALLERLHARLAEADLWVSYNGKSFDLPVLRARFVMNRMPPPPERPQLDLLHVARRVHRHRSYKKALKTIEREVLGHDRGLDIAGSEVAIRYQHYLRTGDEAALQGVVEHNAQDVLSLVALLAVYGAPSQAWLPAEELASMARVVRRAGDLQAARDLAERAVANGAGVLGRRARAEIAKALGDRAQAIEDLEAVVEEASEPVVRLELAKLYEHHLKRPDLALRLIDEGTSEKPELDARRRARLERKAAKERAREGA
jgi:uncharacterized protein YprB with RNaseH-like and TPR domain